MIFVTNFAFLTNSLKPLPHPNPLTNKICYAGQKFFVDASLCVFVLLFCTIFISILQEGLT